MELSHFVTAYVALEKLRMNRFEAELKEEMLV